MDVPSQAFDPRQRRRTSRQLVKELVEQTILAFDLDQHATRLILHEAVKTKTRGQTEHEGAEPDPLHDPIDGDRSALHALA